jgi:hypothetical protein
LLFGVKVVVIAEGTFAFLTEGFLACLSATLASSKSSSSGSMASSLLKRA